MNQAEKDKILSCIEILAIALKKDANIIDSMTRVLAGKSRRYSNTKNYW